MKRMRMMMTRHRAWMKRGARTMVCETTTPLVPLTPLTPLVTLTPLVPLVTLTPLVTLMTASTTQLGTRGTRRNACDSGPRSRSSTV